LTEFLKGLEECSDASNLSPYLSDTGTILFNGRIFDDFAQWVLASANGMNCGALGGARHPRLSVYRGVAKHLRRVMSATARNTPITRPQEALEPFYFLRRRGSNEPLGLTPHHLLEFRDGIKQTQPCIVLLSFYFFAPAASSADE